LWTKRRVYDCWRVELAQPHVHRVPVALRAGVDAAARASRWAVVSASGGALPATDGLQRPLIALARAPAGHPSVISRDLCRMDPRGRLPGSLSMGWGSRRFLLISGGASFGLQNFDTSSSYSQYPVIYHPCAHCSPCSSDAFLWRTVLGRRASRGVQSDGDAKPVKPVFVTAHYRF